MQTNGTNGNGKKQKFILNIAIGIFVILALCVGSVAVVSLYPFTPVVFHEVTLKQDIVTAGQYITYTANFTKYTSKVGTMTRYLVSLNGDATITLNPSGLADAKVADTHKTVIVEIPCIVKPGNYKIRWVVMYEYFGIRQVSVWFETPVFKVIN